MDKLEPLYDSYLKQINEEIQEATNKNDVDKVLDPDEDDPVTRLEEIRDEIKELIDEAKSLVRGTHQYERARSYWIPHILGAIDKDNEYMGGSMINMQDTIDALRQEADEDEVGEDDGSKEWAEKVRVKEHEAKMRKRI